jgi:hypothetical protein
MPKYFVYRADSGQIVHVHEKVDFTSGESVPCTDDEVLTLVDESLQATDLAVVESDIGRLSAGQVLKVDLDTRSVVQAARPSAQS